MNPALRLAIFWIACSAAGLLYAKFRDIPRDLVWRALPAFLLEATFFLSLGSERVRKWLERLPRSFTALALIAAGLAPYCAAAFAFGTFDGRALAWIATLTAVAALWYVVLPHKPLADLAFLVFLAAVVLSRVLRAQYITPHPRLPLDFLGQAMWIRTGAFAMLSVRRVQGVGFGFWPEPRHWRIGILHFLAFLPVAAPAAWAVGFATPHLPAAGWERATVLALGTFFGFLWVIALGEEFLFRGLLQQWLGTWMGNEWLGLIAASLLFGSVHLWYRAFPNWQFAVLAALGGVFYGLAFRRAGSIRASVVTHALTVTTWRIFFS